LKILNADLEEISIIDKSKLLGRDFTLGKKSNPLLDASTTLGLNTIQT
jgi:hypothetical protein